MNPLEFDRALLAEVKRLLPDVGVLHHVQNTPVEPTDVADAPQRAAAAAADVITLLADAWSSGALGDPPSTLDLRFSTAAPPTPVRAEAVGRSSSAQPPADAAERLRTAGWDVSDRSSDTRASLHGRRAGFRLDLLAPIDPPYVALRVSSPAVDVGPFGHDLVDAGVSAVAWPARPSASNETP